MSEPGGGEIPQVEKTPQEASTGFLKGWQKAVLGLGAIAGFAGGILGIAQKSPEMSTAFFGGAAGALAALGKDKARQQQ